MPGKIRSRSDFLILFLHSKKPFLGIVCFGFRQCSEKRSSSLGLATVGALD